MQRDSGISVHPANNPTCNDQRILTLGNHQITAVYSGDNNNTVSSASLMEAADTALPISTLSLTSNPNPSTQNQAVVFKATIIGSAPAGSVTFTDAGSTLCSAVAVRTINSSQTAYCVATFSNTATHPITASYSGDASNAPSTSATLSQSVTVATAFNPNQFGFRCFGTTQRRLARDWRWKSFLIISVRAGAFSLLGGSPTTIRQAATALVYATGRKWMTPARAQLWASIKPPVEISVRHPRRFQPA